MIVNRTMTFICLAALALAVLCVCGCLHADIGNMR